MNRTVVVELGDSVSGRRRLRRVRLEDESGAGWGDRKSAGSFGDLDPATAAEVLTELTELTGVDEATV
ncbi:hypothetical protein FHR81_001949 [Actinoalloteichus hoggarensis]|uniref:hypothetical protein n=1 Tax=Actinoalloteichus hoggarensis TaxID=1470176 RepID=UPI000B8B7C02|nr:hypothetical protein [Actinoalloteichus hoggarensis]MBB5920911.1 hypothetical protein [Actinoalloteichus hoggarensis]